MEVEKIVLGQHLTVHTVISHQKQPTFCVVAKSIEEIALEVDVTLVRKLYARRLFRCLVLILGDSKNVPVVAGGITPRSATMTGPLLLV